MIIATRDDQESKCENLPEVASIQSYKIVKGESRVMFIANLFLKPDIDKLKAKRDVPGLIRAWHQFDPLISKRAAAALGELRDVRAIAPLSKELLSGNRTEIWEAATRALGEIGDPGAVEPLSEFFRRLQWFRGLIEVKKAVIEALGKLGDEKAIGPLIAALKDNHDLHEVAIEALRKIGHPAIKPLIAALYGATSEEWKVVVKALRGIGDRESAEALIDAVMDKQTSARVETIRALGEISDERTIVPLISSMEDNDVGVRASAAETLGKFNDPRVAQALVLALEDPWEDVRSNAAAALQRFDWQPANNEERAWFLIGLQDWVTIVSLGADAVTPVLKLLEGNARRPTRKGAIEALGKIGDARAVDPLIKATQDEDRGVSQAAKEALGKLGDPRGVESLAAAKAMNALLELCTRNDILYPDMLAMLSEVKQNIKSGGDESSRALAQFTLDLLNSRAGNIGWALEAAQAAKGTSELLSAIKLVISAEQIRSGSHGRFPPELSGGAKIGWTDSTYRRIKESATQTLEALSKEPQLQREAELKAQQAVAVSASPQVEPPEQTRLKELIKRPLSWSENDQAEILAMGKSAIGPLLYEVTSGTKDSNDRKPIANLLIQLADESVLDPLIAALQAGNSVTRDAAGLVLEGIGSPAVEPLLAMLGNGPSYTQSKTMEILANLGDKRAIEPISNIFNYFLTKNMRDVPEEGYTAGYALGDLKAASAVQLLIQGLLQSDFKMRRASARALGQIGDAKAVDALTEATQDNDGIVREIAREALKLIGRSN